MPATTEVTTRAAAGRVLFWVASSAVFMVNSILSMTGSRWMLATLQAMTAILAVLAAIEDWDSRRRADRSYSETYDRLSREPSRQPRPPAL